MPCTELQRLREQASTLKHRMDEQRRKALARAGDHRTGRVSGKSEMVPFLQRKLHRLSDKIQQHVAQHRCQD